MDDLWRCNLIGSSPQLEHVRFQIRRLAAVDATVLIEGETGTGKELAARAIHYLGGRSDRPFVPVNCGALSDTLVESELFGHERGAFTDAKHSSEGLVGQAADGTLFLDEVEALSLKAQAALLRFLQDHTYRRVGGSVLRQVDVRVIAASNWDLEEMAQSRAFRRDLLYRLNVLALKIPPLRERAGDGLELAKALLVRLSNHYGTPEKQLHCDSAAFIERNAWPGNVRELENLIHREFLMCEGHEVRLGAPPAPTSVVAEPSHQDASFREAKARAVGEFERRYVWELLARTRGNISWAARIAGKDRSAFGKLVRKHGFGRKSIERNGGA